MRHYALEGSLPTPEAKAADENLTNINAGLSIAIANIQKEVASLRNVISSPAVSPTPAPTPGFGNNNQTAPLTVNTAQ
jgi:hypothetical protein